MALYKVHTRVCNRCTSCSPPCFPVAIHAWRPSTAALNVLINSISASDNMHETTCHIYIGEVKREAEKKDARKAGRTTALTGEHKLTVENTRLVQSPTRRCTFLFALLERECTCMHILWATSQILVWSNELEPPLWCTMQCYAEIFLTPSR